MPTPLEHFQAIVADRNAALNRLADDIEAPALLEFNRLTNKKAKGKLTAAEEDSLAVADAALNRVHHAMWIIGQISLQAMNDSPLLRDIKSSLNGVSKDLKKVEAKLDRIVKVAGTVAKVTEVLVKLAEKVGKAALL